MKTNMRQIKFRAWDKEKKCFVEEIEREFFIGSSGGIIVNFSGELMQYTGLKDKNGVAEVYEGDIIDTYGNIKGNIYEMDKRETDLVIQGFGTSSWEATNKEAMARGLKYSE